MPANDGAQKHRVPVIDRMMEVLAELEGAEQGATIRDLVQRLKLPRTTIYRILNTLQLHEVVRRDNEGAYQLGRRLVRLAAHVPQRTGEEAFIAQAKPFLDALTARLGEGAKLSVIDTEGVLVLATAQGRRQYALAVSAGQRTAVNAGAASKLLLAHLPEPEIEAWLSRPLIGFTTKTVTDPKRLRAELGRIRRQGWAQDKGESAPSIQAFAAPVFDAGGTVIAAISVPFLAGTEPLRMEEIRGAVIEAGKDITRAVLAQTRS